MIVGSPGMTGSAHLAILRALAGTRPESWLHLAVVLVVVCAILAVMAWYVWSEQ